MQEHEDGYCDRCGAEAPTAWISFGGDELCEDCALTPVAAIAIARRPEARDDGR